MIKSLSPQVLSADAARIAGGEVALRHYPLTGIVFRVSASRGPAVRIDGQRLYTLVDRATGFASTAAQWQLAEDPDQGTVPDMDARADAITLGLDEAVTLGRQTLTTALLRRLRLGASFALHLDKVIDPLWKPNWLRTTAAGEQILVDGLDGSVARRTLRP